MGSTSATGTSAVATLLTRTTIERVMEACTADRSRVDEIEAVLAACSHADDMATFRNFWKAFKAALEREGLNVRS
jgi:hypothetical protein